MARSKTRPPTAYRLVVHLSTEEHQQLQTLSIFEGASYSELVRDLIRSAHSSLEESIERSEPPSWTKSLQPTTTEPVQFAETQSLPTFSR